LTTGQEQLSRIRLLSFLVKHFISPGRLTGAQQEFSATASRVRLKVMILIFQRLRLAC